MATNKGDPRRIGSENSEHAASPAEGACEVRMARCFSTFLSLLHTASPARIQRHACKAATSSWVCLPRSRTAAFTLFKQMGTDVTRCADIPVPIERVFGGASGFRLE